MVVARLWALPLLLFNCLRQASYSASEVTTLWRYTNLLIIIIIIIMELRTFVRSP